jgi:hypothetical protein
MSVRDSGVYWASGRATFSARVIELHRAPLWNRTPNRRFSACRPASSQSQKLTPSYSTRPAAGVTSPIMWRSIVLLPQPLPPIITKIWPASMVNETFRCTTRGPKIMSRCSTRMRDSLTAQIPTMLRTTANTASVTMM